MKVGELRKELDGVDPSMPISIKIHYDDDSRPTVHDDVESAVVVTRTLELGGPNIWNAFKGKDKQVWKEFAIVVGEKE